MAKLEELLEKIWESLAFLFSLNLFPLKGNGNGDYYDVGCMISMVIHEL